MNDGIIIEVGMIHKLKELGVTNAAVIMLYGKILTMSEDTGYCTATNTYFANLLAKTPRGIQKYADQRLNSSRKSGYSIIEGSSLSICFLPVVNERRND